MSKSAAIILVLGMVSWACGGQTPSGQTAAPTTSTTAAATSPTAPSSTTADTPTPTTTDPASTTEPTTTSSVAGLAGEPTTQADFDALYRHLDKIRERASDTNDLDLLAQVQPTGSTGYQNLANTVEQNLTRVELDDFTYTVDEVLLVDRPSENRALLLVTDTSTGTITWVDSEGNEASSASRSEPATRVFFVTLERHEGNWLILDDQEMIADNIARPPYPPDDAITQAESTQPGVERYHWLNADGLPCMEVRIVEPALGRFVYCDPADSATNRIWWWDHSVVQLNAHGDVIQWRQVFFARARIEGLSAGYYKVTAGLHEPTTHIWEYPDPDLDIGFVWDATIDQVDHFSVHDPNGAILYEHEDVNG